MNRNTKHDIFKVCIAVALLGAFVGGASAAINPEGYMGTVVGKDTGNNTFEVQTTHNWSNTQWQYNSTTMEWIFPNEDAANGICVGDYVEILGFAAYPGEVIGLGRMNSSTEMFITDIYGDPYFLEPYWYSEPLDPPLLGNFTIEYDNTPNCSNCGICNCEANYTDVTIINGTGVEVNDHQLYPGQTCIYEGIGYRIDITFHSGEASACPACSDAYPLGNQPISNFTIHIAAANPFQTTPRGDLNGDGEITSIDAMIALEIAVSSGDSGNADVADIDDDGRITSLDALMILQTAAGTIEI